VLATLVESGLFENGLMKRGSSIEAPCRILSLRSLNNPVAAQYNLGLFVWGLNGTPVMIGFFEPFFPSLMMKIGPLGLHFPEELLVKMFLIFKTWIARLSPVPRRMFPALKPVTLYVRKARPNNWRLVLLLELKRE